MKIIANFFLLSSFIYTFYYTLKNDWISGYMNFGICPSLPLLLLVTQLQNFVNIICCCKCYRYLQFIFTIIFYSLNIISYICKLCYDDYDKTMPDLINCFEFNLLMQTFYIIILYIC